MGNEQLLVLVFSKQTKTPKGHQRPQRAIELP
jgi:hypothetical protein